LKVTTRAGYASRNERRANRAPMTPVIETLQSPLSVSSGLTLKVAAVPFRGKGSKASVGVVVHAGGNDLQMAVTAGRFNGSIDVAIVAANADGQSKGSERGTLHLQLNPGNASASRSTACASCRTSTCRRARISSGWPWSTVAAPCAAAFTTTWTFPTSRRPGYR
jgi:hypothetical protein